VSGGSSGDLTPNGPDSRGPDSRGPDSRETAARLSGITNRVVWRRSEPTAQTESSELRLRALSSDRLSSGGAARPSVAVSTHAFPDGFVFPVVCLLVPMTSPLGVRACH